MNSILNKCKLNRRFKMIGIILASIMFIWSGFNKIFNFNKKVLILQGKIGLGENICRFGMILVILLEIIGFLLLIEYFLKQSYLYNIFDKLNIFMKISQEELIQIILLLILLFLFVVTIIYHPFDIKKPIPFLSNLTTFGLFLYIYVDIYSYRKSS